MISRQGIIIYLHNLRQAKSLRKYGHVHYISRKMKYVVLYCNQEDVESVMKKVRQCASQKRKIARNEILYDIANKKFARTADNINHFVFVVKMPGYRKVGKIIVSQYE